RDERPCDREAAGGAPSCPEGGNGAEGAGLCAPRTRTSKRSRTAQDCYGDAAPSIEARSAPRTLEPRRELAYGTGCPPNPASAPQSLFGNNRGRNPPPADRDGQHGRPGPCAG